MTKPKPKPKRPEGRPRAVAPAELVAAGLQAALDAMAYVHAVIRDESIEHKDRLRAATLALEYATRPAAEKPEDVAKAPEAQVVRVVYASDYRASTG